ncbi:hypothetical protein ACQ86N_01385 [Puia sp. P3]|uniref:hypothetical protein n=1 Tax=Puia sp. P3 TaxID=3423952 RepID=UPI003D673FCA
MMLLFLFINRTRQEYYNETRTLQFSAFGGWQMGSNALYGYAHAALDSSLTVPTKFRDLHRLVNQHMIFLNQFPSFMRPDHNVDIYYLWDFNSPLRVYMNDRWKKDSTTSFFIRWAAMAPLYSDYGRYLIARHPGPFAQYYLWPNLIKYYAPPTGFLGYYNLERDTVEQIAVRWFHWENNKVFFAAF